MLRFRFLLIVCSLVAVCATPLSVSADPVQIAAGSMLRVGGVQDFSSRGFMRQIAYELGLGGLTIAWADSDYLVQDYRSPALPRPTRLGGPGAPPSGSESIGFLDLASLTITASPSLTPSPFLLTGFFRIVDQEGAVLFNDAVAGAGTASWTFVNTPSGGPVVSSVLYQFSEADPVPEPVSLVLVGTGLAGVALGRRRRTAGTL
jgi:hypothetical protein